MTDTPPPFETVTIAGVGLIGGSIALALREQWPSVRIVGVDRPAVLAHALSSNAIDRGAGDVAAAGDADLIILAAPVSHNLQLLQDLAPRVRPSTVITDVGGTKRAIAAAARALPTRVSFIGGHPIGGAERGGFGFARPNLFVGRPWLFTPDADQPTDTLDRLFALVRGIGAEPITIDAETHDRLMAYVSHLPQLTATALMRVTGRGAIEDGLKLSGRGLLDTTRLASSPASVWSDICTANADFIARALDEMIGTLQSLRADLEKGETLDDLFSDAARWRAELLKQQH
jgi:prephenate dehydrogenase